MLDITLAIIAKNEEAVLADCINSVAMFVKDIVVVDTGSTDETKRIAQKAGARIFDFKWVNDFATARNYAATRAKFDWILALDADEVVTLFDYEQVAEFLENPQKVGRVLIHDMSGRGEVAFQERISRLYHREYYEFKGIIHEQIVSKQGGTAIAVDVPIEADHFGYAPQVMREKGKFERNRSMLEMALKDEPADPYLLYQMGKTYYAAGEFKQAADYLERALRENPDYKLSFVYNAVESYGYALINSKQYEKAMCMVNFEDLYGKNPAFRFLLGHVYLNNARLSDALASFESCIGADDAAVSGISSYLAYYNIGVILEVAGFADNAAQYYKECGDYARAKERLAEIIRK